MTPAWLHAVSLGAESLGKASGQSENGQWMFSYPSLPFFLLSQLIMLIIIFIIKFITYLTFSLAIKHTIMIDISVYKCLFPVIFLELNPSNKIAGKS